MLAMKRKSKENIRPPLEILFKAYDDMPLKWERLIPVHRRHSVNV